MITQTPNPYSFRYWKDIYDQFEQTWTKPMHELIGTESFAAGMSATRDNYLTSQKTLRDGMEQYLKSLQIPTRGDITRLAGQVVALESKLEGLEDRFDALEERFGGLDGRFDRLDSKLDAIVAEVAKLAAKQPAPVVEAVVPPAEEATETVATQPAKRRNK